MSIGPILQADINMPIRHVHKTEEKEKVITKTYGSSTDSTRREAET